MSNLDRPISEERSILMHREIGVRLRVDPSLVERAKQTLARWEQGEHIHPEYASAWKEVLSLPLEELIEVIADPSQRMRDLRQNTPFAGILDAQTRWRIIRETRPRHDDAA